MKQSLLNMSIRRKLMALTMLTSGAVLLLVTLAFVVNETITFRNSIRQELTALAHFIGMNTTAAITFDDRKSAEVTLSGLKANTHILVAAILTPEGTIFAEYRAPGASAKPLHDKPLADKDKEEGREWGSSFEVRTPVLLDGQKIGTVVIRAGSMELISRLAWFLVIVCIIMIAALVIAYALSTKLQGPIADPILVLVQVMRSVTEGKNYALRAKKQSSDEIGQLIDGFNDMLSQIQKRDEHLEHFASELKESNEELKAFIYSAAHDLRQPLVNIKGFTGETVRSLRDIQNILRANSDHFPENDRDRIFAIIENDIHEASGFVSSSVERMAVLINALLKLSQIGYRELKPDAIDMKSMVRAVMNTLAHQFRERGVSIDVGALPDVVADRTVMEQAIANLLDNAVKYLEKGRPGTVKISGERLEAETVYHVRDNGRGISRDDMQKLFKIFRRLGSQDVAGHGVGLAYVRALIRRHGGRIWCESELGKGSTFSFSIPDATARAEQVRTGRRRTDVEYCSLPGDGQPPKP